MYNSGVYKLINSMNGKIYIGSSVALSKRFYEHFRLLKNLKHPNQKLQNAFNKYGEGSFSAIPMIYCSKKDLIFYEQRFLDCFNPEYNILKDATTRLNVRHTPETIEKLRIASSGRKASPETLEKLRLHGLKHRNEPRVLEALKLGGIKNKGKK